MTLRKCRLFSKDLNAPSCCACRLASTILFIACFSSPIRWIVAASVHCALISPRWSLMAAKFVKAFRACLSARPSFPSRRNLEASSNSRSARIARFWFGKKTKSSSDGRGPIPSEVLVRDPMAKTSVPNRIRIPNRFKPRSFAVRRQRSSNKKARDVSPRRIYTSTALRTVFHTTSVTPNASAKSRASCRRPSSGVIDPSSAWT